MSESEDEAAFTSADEDVETSQSVATGNKKPAAKIASVKDNKESEEKESEKEKTSINNMNSKKQKKKNKRAKTKEEPKEEEYAAEKLSFESSDSVVSTETSPVQIDNMHSSKPDLEEIRITDESDDSNRTSRNNLFDYGNGPKESNEVDDTRTGTTTSLKKDVKESQDETDSQISNEKSEKAPQQSGWGWTKWGSSIIGAAASSVSTFTSQLGDGVNTIIDTVESGLSVVPTPEELAREAEETESTNFPQEKDSVTDAPTKSFDDQYTTGEMASESVNPGGWWSGWGVSKLTGAVQEKSKNLVTGSLDVLESIGRKTFDAINDHDRAVLREKTKMLFERGESPQLADLLKEAKEKTEIKEKIAKENEEALKSDFAALFEDFQGQAHMDALQLLSQQSEAKLGLMLESLSPDSEKETQVRSQLLAIKDAFEVAIEDEDDLDKDHLFARLVTDHLSEVHLGTQPDKLNMCQASTRKWIAEFIETHSIEKEMNSEEETKQTNAKDIYTTAIQSIAELTSKIIEQFHKSGELILLQKDLDKNMEDRAKSLASLTKIFWTEINILSTKFAKCLNIVEEKEEDEKTVNQYITNVYLEASNSSSYIDDGFRSLLPIMQLALLEKNFKE